MKLDSDSEFLQLATTVETAVGSNRNSTKHVYEEIKRTLELWTFDSVFQVGAVSHGFSPQLSSFFETVNECVQLKYTQHVFVSPMKAFFFKDGCT